MSTVVEPLPPPRVVPSGGRWIHDWRPEDRDFWAHTGAAVARRNLVFSILCEHIGFSVWSIWSVLVLFLGPAYGIDPAGKFLLTAVPALIGSVVRLPYTYAVARFGGRNWTVASAALLLVPCVGIALWLTPGVSYATLMVLAAVAGVGGGNFASSMANINAFYPDRLKGWALGINAGGGNVGVAAVQLVGLAVLAVLGAGHPRIVAGVYIPLIVVAALLAYRYLDNLAGARNDRRALRDVIREPHAWVMCLLYIGTFGSFIGFGFAFGQVLADRPGRRGRRGAGQRRLPPVVPRRPQRRGGLRGVHRLLRDLLRGDLDRLPAPLPPPSASRVARSHAVPDAATMRTLGVVTTTAGGGLLIAALLVGRPASGPG